MTVHIHPQLRGLGGEIFENLPSPTLIVDADVTILHANRAARAALGLDEGTVPLLLRRGGELLHCIHSFGEGGCGHQQACQDCVIRDAVRKAFEHGLIQRHHTTLNLRSGTDVTEASFLISASPIHNDGETQVILTLEDVTDFDHLKEEVGLAEQALRENQRVLLLSQEIARIGSYVFDVTEDHWSSSPALDDIFGIDENCPRKASDWLQIIHPEDREAMRLYLADLLARAPRFDREYRVVNQKNGETRWVHGIGELQRGQRGKPTRLVGTIQDITTRKMSDIERDALQRKLALASRLAAMGTLVAGVAHEINNPLSAQLSGQGIALELARDARMRRQLDTRVSVEQELHLLDGVIEALEDAQEGGQRVARIVKDMAALASPDQRRLRVRISDIVADAMRWVPASVSTVATVKVESQEPPDVMASAGQIEQVVVNLITNAAKATPVGKHGDVLIRTSAGSHGMARMEVIDHGTGIPPAILGRIFEPFFTTRQVGEGRGTGLGLAVCHAIVTAHGGTLTVESEVGTGSTFRVELPAAPAEA